MSDTPPTDGPPDPPDDGDGPPDGGPPDRPGAGAGGRGGGATSLGLEPNIAALLAYVAGWISGLVIYLIEQDHPEVRFHAAQSILISLVLIGVYIALSVIGLIPVIGLVVLPVFLILGLASVGLWIYLLVQGYNLKHTKLPVVGDMAEQWADRPIG